MIEKIIEMSDKVTGESYPVKETIAWIGGDYEPVDLSAAEALTLKKYKANFQPYSDGIGEVNEGEYLVDDTGYCSLADILKRCLRQGINPVQMVDGEYTEDEVMSEDELSTTEAGPTTQAQVVDNSKENMSEASETDKQSADNEQAE